MLTSEDRRGRCALWCPPRPGWQARLWSYRNRRLVAITWIVVLIAISLAGRLAGSAFKDNLNGGTSTPSQQAATFLQRNFPSQAGDTAQVVFQTTGPVSAAAAQDRITGTLAGLAGLPGVASVLSPFAGGPFAAGAAHQVSPDGHIAYGVIRFDGSGDAIPDPAIQRVITQAQRAAGPVSPCSSAARRCRRWRSRSSVKARRWGSWPPS